ncbi:MAG: glycosyltransferase family 9 protein [Candidatus Omnitrophica bacterium]|nr:glycosyltransferase family 9 protein [Candidatus Omnitrophota bacterium]
MTEFKNILVVRSDRMGDLVLTTPALKALRKSFPSARISLWVDRSTQDLVNGVSFIDEVLAEDRSLGWRGYLHFLTMLRKRQFDLAIIYHTKRRTNATCFLAGIPVRLGYKNNKFGFLLNRPVLDERHFGKKHESEYCLDLLESIGVKGKDFAIEVAANRDADIWAEKVFIKHGLLGKTVVALHPDASCSTRLWPTDSFARLAERLVNECQVTVLIIGAENARSAAQKIMEKGNNNTVDLTGQTTLAQMVSVLRRSHLLVSNDSGPVHVGAAVGIPVISLFLRSQPGINSLRWRPLGSLSVLICNEKDEEIKLDREGQVVSGKFDSIGVDSVFKKACAILSMSPNQQKAANRG